LIKVLNNEDVDYSILSSDEQVKLIEVCEIHDLELLFYQSYSKWFRSISSDEYSEVYEQWKTECLKKTLESKLRYKNTKEVINHLMERDIKVLLFKGLDYASYYNDFCHRIMCDVDLCVSKSDYKKAYKLLKALNFNAKPDDNIDVIFADRTRKDITFKKKNFYPIELHFDLVNKDAYKEFSSFKVDIETDCVFVENDNLSYFKLNISDNIIYCLIHIYCHFKASGIGYKQLIDLYHLSTADEIDWQYITEKLKEYGILHFSKLIYIIIRDLFGINVIVEKFNLDDTIDDIVVELFMEDMYKGGSFGYSDRNNYISKQVADYNVNNKSSILNLIKFAFPQKEHLMKNPRYDYCSNVLLLPIAWLHRLSRNIRLGRLSLFNKNLSWDSVNRRKYIMKWINEND